MGRQEEQGFWRWESAEEYCEKVLDIDPKNAYAYLGKLMVELRLNTKEQFMNYGENQTER